MKRNLQQLAARMDDHLRQFQVDLGNEVRPYVPMVLADEAKKRSKEYPCLYIYGRKDKGIFDLPKSGKAVVKYRVKSRTVRTDDDGSDRYSSDIEIQTIDPVKGKTDLAAILERYTSLDAGRARDAAGRYADGDAPPSPDDMATAYARKRKKAVAIGAAGAATVAAGALPVSRRGAARLGAGALRAAARLR